MSKQLPKGWKLVPLEKVSTIIMGQSPPSSSYNDSEDGLPFYQGKSDFGEDHPSPSKWCSSPSKIAEALDVLISVRAPVGDVNICQARSCIGRGLSALRVHDNSIHYKYLYFYLKSNKSCWTRFITGSTFEAIASKTLQEQYIPVPPLETQDKIVRILDEADNLRKLRKKSDDKMKELIPALFDEMFGDPVTNPKGWSNKKFGDAGIMIIDGDRGSNYPQKQDFTDQGYCLFLNTKNVRPDGFRFNDYDFITKEKDESLRKGKLQRHDVVLTTRGTVGNVAFYDDSIPYEKIRINSGMVILRPDHQIFNPKYISLLLQTHYIRNQFELISSGCAQPQLPIRSLITLNVPMHQFELQKEFVDKVALIELESKRQNTSTCLIDDLFNSLMDRCMSGKII